VAVASVMMPGLVLFTAAKLMPAVITASAIISDVRNCLLV